MLTVRNYDNVIFNSHVSGYWRPLEKATPYEGTKGEISFGTECKMEFRCFLKNIEEVKRVIKSVHPYEEPIINLIPILN